MKTLKDPRGQELLADRALTGISTEESADLERRLRAEGVGEDDSFDLTAAALDLALMGKELAPMPADLAARVTRQAAERIASAPRRATSTTAAGAQVVIMSPAADTPPRTDWRRWSGWAAAAAILVGAVGANFREGRDRPADQDVATASAIPGRTIAISSAGAHGSLVWDDEHRRGDLRVRGLPAGRYDAWIEDAQRSWKLAAGSFESTAGDESRLRVESPIPPDRPQRVIVTSHEDTSGATPALIVSIGSSGR